MKRKHMSRPQRAVSWHTCRYKGTPARGERGQKPPMVTVRGSARLREVPARQHVLRAFAISFTAGVSQAPRRDPRRSRTRHGPCKYPDERTCMEGSLTASRRPKKAEDTSGFVSISCTQPFVAASFRSSSGTILSRIVDLRRNRENKAPMTKALPVRHFRGRAVRARDLLLPCPVAPP